MYRNVPWRQMTIKIGTKLSKAQGVRSDGMVKLCKLNMNWFLFINYYDYVIKTV